MLFCFGAQAGAGEAGVKEAQMTTPLKTQKQTHFRAGNTDLFSKCDNRQEQRTSLVHGGFGHHKRAKTNPLG